GIDRHGRLGWPAQRFRVVVRDGARPASEVAGRSLMVFLTGATGYMGRRLAAELVRLGRPVTALVRQGAESRAPQGCAVSIGDALDASTYRERVPKGCAFVHLVGVAHPSPAKAAEFQAIDLESIRAAVEAARFAQVRHFVYVSVAHPAPVMRAYIAVRTE